MGDSPWHESLCGFSTGPTAGEFRRHPHARDHWPRRGQHDQADDERITRFHLKIQDDRDKVVLTDLESTNGTKVNGEGVQLSIVRPGDVIALGRTVLLFGSRDDIARRLALLRGADFSEAVVHRTKEEGGRSRSRVPSTSWNSS